MAAKGSVDSFDPVLFAQARAAAGLTQADVAAKVIAATRQETADVRKAARELETVRLQVNDYEGGSFVPRPQMLLNLANALGVDPFQLLRPDTTVTLALARVRRGLLQSDLTTLGCSREQYSKVERGLAKLSDADEAALAAALDLSPAELAEAMTQTATVAEVLARR